MDKNDKHGNCKGENAVILVPAIWQEEESDGQEEEGCQSSLLQEQVWNNSSLEVPELIGLLTISFLESESKLDVFQGQQIQLPNSLLESKEFRDPNNLCGVMDSKSVADIECVAHTFHTDDSSAIILWVFVEDFVETYSYGLFLIIFKVFQVFFEIIVDGFIARTSVLLLLIKAEILLAFEKGRWLEGESVANGRDDLCVLWKVERRENEFHGGVHLISHLN